MLVKGKSYKRLYDINNVINKGVVYAGLLCIVTIIVSLFKLIVNENNQINPYLFPPLTTSILFFLYGVYLCSKNIKSSVNNTFTLFLMSLAIWLSGYSVIYSTSNYNDAIFWGKYLYIGVIFIPTTFYHFTVELLKIKEQKKIVVIAYLISSIFLIFLFSTDWFVKGLYKYYWGYYVKSGFMQGIFLIYFFGIYSKGLVNLYTGYKKQKAQKSPEYKKTQYVFWAFFVAVIGAIDYLPNYGIEYYPLGYLLVGTLLFSISYLIIQYNLMDIQTVMHKTLIWATLSSMVFVPVFGIFYIGHDWLNNLGNLYISILVTGMFMLLLLYTKTIQPRIDHLFQRRKYNLQDILENFIQEIAILKGLDNLIDKILQTVISAFYLENASFVLYNNKTGEYELAKEIGLKVKKDFSTNDNRFFKWAEESNRVIELTEIDNNPSLVNIKRSGRRYFNKVKAIIAIPLIHNHKLIGMVNLGQKKNLRGFARIEIDFLSHLKVETSIALSNSLLFDDITKMSEELQEWTNELEHKVDERTKELADSNQEIEQAYNKLKELDHLKSEFFANISHELRTPLTLIIAPIESMLAGELGRHKKERIVHLNIMYDNSLRLLRLINNLLDLAKIDAGRMEIYYTKANISEFIKGVLSSVSSVADKKRIRLTYSSEDKFPDIYFDRDKMERVMLNLIFNSLKFTDEGGEIIISNGQDNGNIWVKIKDTGIGIPREYLSKIFQRFSQVDGSARRKYGGTGIGLALTKEIVELHNGKIYAESEKGKGTTIKFTVPAITEMGELYQEEERIYKNDDDWTRNIYKIAEYSTADAMGHKKDSARLKKVEKDKDIDPKKEKILIVEDNIDMVNFISLQLEDEYEIEKAGDGAEGVEEAKKGLPDLIISDVMMPLKDGYQLLKEIKSDFNTRHIPVILLTAKADLSDKIDGLEYGADDYLTKPFNSQELKAKIRSLINLRKLEKEIQERNEELEKTLKELRNTQAQLIHSEKMAALGVLVAGVAHEISNPVSFTKGSINNISRCFNNVRDILNRNPLIKDKARESIEDMESSLNIVKTGLERTEGIVIDLKTFVRKDQFNFNMMDIHKGLDSTLQLLQYEIKHKINLHKDYGNIRRIEAIAGHINQVFMNILQNAIQAISGKGDIWIKTEEQIDNDMVIISIKDNGMGIKEEYLSRICEPFFTTKDVGKGTGLGLSVSYKIIETHGGKIEVKSRDGEGTEFIIVLPITQSKRDILTLSAVG
ncbi:MAG: ATP-binding protein [Nitrospirota bacterium]